MAKIKYLIVLFVLFANYIDAHAQISKKQLLGNWGLTALIDKRISESELQKRYQFKQDSLIYSSPRRAVKGTFKVDEKTGKVTWRVTVTPTPIMLQIKFVSDSIIQLSQLEGISTVGVLKKIKD